MTRLFRQLLAVDFGFIAGWLLRGITVLSVLTIGLVSWKDAFDADVSSVESFAESVRTTGWWLGVVLVATLLTALNPGGWILRMRARGDASRVRVSNWCNGFEKVVGDIKPRANNHNNTLETFYERILRSAEAELRLALGLSEHERMKTNLVLYQASNANDPNPDLEVVARSQPQGPVPRTIGWEDGGLCETAMSTNTTVVRRPKPPVRRDGKVVYKEISATPITWKRRAYGAITVDVRDSGLLRSRKDLVDDALRPHAAAITVLLDLTDDSGAKYCSCPDAYWA